jgi:fatty acid desaturase
VRIPDPQEPVPAVALPALALFAGGLGLWVGSSALALTGAWPMWVSVLPNAVAAYLLFTVAHDAGHRSLSRSDAVNHWLGRVSIFLFAPHASFKVWRFIHMQHHRFTNHDDGRDPDRYTQGGPPWQWPLRWLTIDLHYLVFYARHLRRRPRAEQAELAVTWVAFATAVAALVATGNVAAMLLLWLVPARLAVMWLGFAFDFLPHHGLHHTPEEHRFRTTRNRVGLERLMTPALLYQNYHLVHHLHPTIPFHRYVAVWRRNAPTYLDAEAEVTDVRGRPLSPEERRRLRMLAAHH